MIINFNSAVPALSEFEWALLCLSDLPSNSGKELQINQNGMNKYQIKLTDQQASKITDKNSPRNIGMK